MKKGLLFSVVLASGFVFASPLGDAMKQLGHDFKQLNAQITDPTQNASTIKVVEDMEAAAKTSRGIMPDMVADLSDPAQQSVQMTAYQADMDRLIAAIDQVKVGLQTNKDGKNTDAIAARDSITAIMRDGHSKFRSE